MLAHFFAVEYRGVLPYEEKEAEGKSDGEHEYEPIHLLLINVVCCLTSDKRGRRKSDAEHKYEENRTTLVSNLSSSPSPFVVFQACVDSPLPYALELASQHACQVRCLVTHRILVARRKLLKSCQGKRFREIFDHAEHASIQRLINLSSVLNVLHR